MAPYKKEWIVLHHTAGPATQTVEQIRAYHMAPPPKGRGFKDIGYNFVIRADGSVGTGRPLLMDGAHTDGRAPGSSPTSPSLNRCSIGISCIGNFDTTQMPPAQFGGLLVLVLGLMKEHALTPDRVLLHRQQIGGTATACPGKFFPEVEFRKAVAEGVKPVADTKWAEASIKWAREVGLMKGDQNGVIDPAATLTVGQAAVLFQRFAENVLPKNK